MLTFSAKVIRGEGRGKKLGFPTANLDTKDLEIEFGVYLIEIEINGIIYKGLMHFGPKKTFNRKESAEIHIPGFKGNIYGKKATVKVLKKIREIRKFKNAVELKRQIEKDIIALK